MTLATRIHRVEPTPLVPGSPAARALLAFWRDREHEETVPYEHLDAVPVIVEHLHLRGGYAVSVTAPTPRGVHRALGRLATKRRLTVDVDGGPVDCLLEPADEASYWEHPGCLTIRVYDDRVAEMRWSYNTRLRGDIPLDVILAGQATR